MPYGGLTFWPALALHDLFPGFWAGQVEGLARTAGDFHSPSLSSQTQAFPLGKESTPQWNNSLPVAVSSSTSVSHLSYHLIFIREEKETCLHWDCTC